MSTSIVLAAGGLFVLILAFALWRTDARGGWWALAWSSLYLSGVFSALAVRWHSLSALYPLFGTAFAALLYAGARAFGGRAPPRWLWPATAAIALGRAALALAAPFELTQAGAIAVIVAGSLASTREVARVAFRRGAGVASRALACALPAVGLASAIYELSRDGSLEVPLPSFVWLVTGVIVAGLQFAVLIEDVARRVAAERATLAAIVESAPLGLALVDERGVTRHNAVFASLTGMREQGASEERGVARIVRRISASAAPSEDALARGDVELDLQDGRRAISSQRPVYDERGAEIGRLWMLREVTVERRLQDDLRRARQLETIGRLAGGVAHDFNNQLTVVLGNAALLEDSLGADDPRAAPVAEIARAADHCAAITRDLLDFARQSPSQRGPVDLVQLAREQTARLARSRPPGVALGVEAERAAPSAHADRAQVQRVLDNLLANALAAVSERGRVEVAVRASPHRLGHVELSVADDGPGMSDAVRERVFDPFFTTRREEGGTGLGLAIVHGIVSAHGGDVHVETSPRGGARFVTTWPVAQDGAPATPQPDAALAPPRGCAVLLVEDEAGVRRLAASALRGAGHRVIEFVDAESALRALVAGLDPIDVAVVDFSLPGLSGDVVIAELRKRRPELPVVLMSGHLTQPAAQGVPFLAKPFRANDLLGIVGRLVAQRP